MYTRARFVSVPIDTVIWKTDTLPAYGRAFNAVGDGGLIGDSIGSVNSYPPDKVARATCNDLPALVDGIGHIVVSLALD